MRTLLFWVAVLYLLANWPLCGPTDADAQEAEQPVEQTAEEKREMLLAMFDTNLERGVTECSAAIYEMLVSRVRLDTILLITGGGYYSRTVGVVASLFRPVLARLFAHGRPLLAG